ncbi:hypothetical protein BJ741DRAFT_612232 [Chytriomyces cf. hyalinus JEL632]|nr:hypothetical protein BJ741DRAFT_612232 [Chytriomyces cf. hyalinus JEL632]
MPTILNPAWPNFAVAEGTTSTSFESRDPVEAAPPPPPSTNETGTLGYTLLGIGTAAFVMNLLALGTMWILTSRQRTSNQESNRKRVAHVVVVDDDAEVDTTDSPFLQSHSVQDVRPDVGFEMKPFFEVSESVKGGPLECGSHADGTGVEHAVDSLVVIVEEQAGMRNNSIHKHVYKPIG